MRILWAQALSDETTALVVAAEDGNLLGGVGYLRSYEHEIEHRNIYHTGLEDSRHVTVLPPTVTSTFNFRWMWYKIVDSVDAFRDSKGWEQPPRALEPPTIDAG